MKLEMTDYRERRMAHTDEDRELARARLRVADAEYRKARQVMEAKSRERDHAAKHANDTGIALWEIAEVYGVSEKQAWKFCRRAQGGKEERD